MKRKLLGSFLVLALTCSFAAGNGDLIAPPAAPQPAVAAAAQVVGPTFERDQFKKIRDEEAKQAARAEAKATFNTYDKPQIAEVLKQIIPIIKSKRDGVAKIRKAALRLHQLLEIQKDYQPGTDYKMGFMSSLIVAVAQDRRQVLSVSAYDYTQEDVNAELASLIKDKYDPKIVNVLKEFYEGEIKANELFSSRDSYFVLREKLGLVFTQ